MFAIKNIQTGNLMFLECSSNYPDDFCNDTSTHLVDYPTGALFVADTREEAEKVIHEKNAWYSSSHRHPGIAIGEYLKVVEVKEVTC